MARTYLFDSYSLDVRARVLAEGGRNQSLTPKAVATLTTLLDRSNEVVTKEDLIARVWGGAYVEEGVVAQNIYLLRRALGSSARNLIETIPGRGYRLQAKVRKVSTDGDNVRKLAVLPFACLGYVDEAEVLSLAMADALATELGGRPELVVRPSAAIRGLAAGGREDPIAAGRALRVDAVVTGTLQQAGDRLRATVQLLSLESESSTWAERFDAPKNDLFALQDAVAEALAKSIMRGGRGRRRQAQPSNPEAYLCYARGRYFWNKRTARGLEKAIGCFQRAIELEPGFALAHAGLADTYALAPLYAGAKAADSFPTATAAAVKALALDSQLAPAVTSLAYARFLYYWDWSSARKGFEKALHLDPNYPTAHHWLGFLYSTLGRHEEAVAFASRAVELDPLSLVMNSDLGLVLYAAGRTGEAVGQFERTLDLDPSFAYAHFGAALACCELGHEEEAVQSGRRAVELEGSNPAMTAVLSYTLARAGHLQEARRRLDIFKEGPSADPAYLALIHTGLGEYPQALNALDQACKERSRFLPFLPTWSVWNPLRQEPGFTRIVSQLGF